MYQIFVIQITFWSSDWVELDFLFCDQTLFEHEIPTDSFLPKGPTTPKIWDVKLFILAITNM